MHLIRTIFLLYTAASCGGAADFGTEFICGQCPTDSFCESDGFCRGDAAPSNGELFYVYRPDDPSTHPSFFSNSLETLSINNLENVGRIELDCQSPFPCMQGVPLPAVLTLTTPSPYVGGRDITQTVAYDTSFRYLTAEQNSTLSITPTDEQIPPAAVPAHPVTNPIVLGPNFPQVSLTLPTAFLQLNAKAWIETLTGQRVSGKASTSGVTNVALYKRPGDVGPHLLKIEVAVGDSPQQSQTAYYTIPIDLVAGDLNLGTISLSPIRETKPVALSVSGFSPDGSRLPTVGASVRLQTQVSGSPGEEPYQLVVRSITDTEGTASMQLMQGTPTVPLQYDAVVLPARTERSATSLTHQIEVTSLQNNDELPELLLGTRLVVTGTLLDTIGTPSIGTDLYLRFSQEYLDSLPSDIRARHDQILLPQTTTDEGGQFSFFVDPSYADFAPRFELFASPSTSIGTFLTSFETTQGSDGLLELTEVILPTHYWIPLPTKELPAGTISLYQIASQNYCEGRVDCAIPATLVDIQRNDAGEVRVPVQQLR